MVLNKCTKGAMPCEIKSKEGDEERELSLTSDCILPDIVAFVPMVILKTKNTRNS